MLWHAVSILNTAVQQWPQGDTEAESAVGSCAAELSPSSVSGPLFGSLFAWTCEVKQ